jgi:CubicO group peptidase (beta-lactamase class C family)
VLLAATIIGMVASGPPEPGSYAAAATLAHPGAEVLHDFFTRQVAASPLPGLAVAVTRGDGVVHLGGYGSAGHGRPMTPDTPMRAGSLSKAFTAAAVLRLVERGQADLDSPVQAYLPEFAVADAAVASCITVRQLLNQTSGLADRGFTDLWDLDQDRPAERVEVLATAHPVAAPGSAHHYFNPNYEALARLVEVLSGQDFGEYLTQHVFDPLGMHATVSVDRAEKAPVAVPDLAQGHVVVFGVPVARDEPPGFTTGSAGVVTTARDLATWLRVNSAQGQFEGRQVLEASSIRMSHTPPPGLDSAYAMGWWEGSIGAHRVVEHNGVLATAYAHQVLVPQTGHGVALLANANHAFNDVPRIMEGVVALLTVSDPPASPLSHRRLAVVVAVLVVGGMAWRWRGLVRRYVWADQRVVQRLWRTTVGLARLLLPALLLVASPSLILLASGRYFPHRLLLLAFPELVIWLVLSTVTGSMLATARVRSLRSARR